MWITLEPQRTSFPQISDGTLKANITELLDITFYALDADPFLLPYLQSNTQCLQTTDTNKTLGHFVYDYLHSELLTWRTC